MSNPSDKKRIVYQEFGPVDNSADSDSVAEKPPKQQNIRIQATRAGRKGKTVTVVSGFESSPETLADLLKKLKTHCGCGGTLKDNILEIQGEHKEKILQLLTQLGYKAKISGG